MEFERPVEPVRHSDAGDHFPALSAQLGQQLDYVLIGSLAELLRLARKVHSDLTPRPDPLDGRITPLPGHQTLLVRLH